MTGRIRKNRSCLHGGKETTERTGGEVQASRGGIPADSGREAHCPRGKGHGRT